MHNENKNMITRLTIGCTEIAGKQDDQILPK